MRSTIVPAQITTVEDKIFGNITVQQGLLLGVPLLLGFVFTILLPPNGQFVDYKVLISFITLIICGVLAVRIKERIIAQWLVLFARYAARPEYFVYDKNSAYLRVEPPTHTDLNDLEAVPVSAKRQPHPADLPHHEFARLERLVQESKAELKFEVGKKGELNVRVTEGQ